MGKAIELQKTETKPTKLTSPLETAALALLELIFMDDEALTVVAELLEFLSKILLSAVVVSGVYVRANKGGEFIGKLSLFQRVLSNVDTRFQVL